jgi:hypothetical protein
MHPLGLVVQPEARWSKHRRGRVLIVQYAMYPLGLVVQPEI